jgi:hypothetical protein
MPLPRGRQTANGSAMRLFAAVFGVCFASEQGFNTAFTGGPRTSTE